MPGFARAQEARDNGASPPMLEPVRMIELNEAVGVLSFRHRSGATLVEMTGTRILPDAFGRMKVESKKGYLEIDVNRNGIVSLPPASRWGRDFLTYVFWAVSVDGNTENLGEILFETEAAETTGINVTTPFQTFWLMITAEPHFAVSEPSGMVVMVSRGQEGLDTQNRGQPVSASPIYYSHYAASYDTRPADKPVHPSAIPSELLQARKAVELAASAGILKNPPVPGEQPLADETRARNNLEQAREFLRHAEFSASGGDERYREAIQFARTAAQAAESARALAVGAVGQVYIRQLHSEIERVEKQLRETQAANAGLTEALAAARRQVDELTTRQRDSLSGEKQLRAELERVSARLADSETRAGQALAQLDAAKQEIARLHQIKEQICQELRQQLESLGRLRDEGSGIVLTLAADILFDFDKYELKNAAREQLAKLAVLQTLLFRDVPVKYDGHTDWVGGEDYNQWLSEQRALRVAEYLLEQQRSLAGDEPGQPELKQRLAVIGRLLAMDFGRSTGKEAADRKQLLASLSELVEGHGFRQPVVSERGKNERNRRVDIRFTKPNQATILDLCDDAATPPVVPTTGNKTE